MHAWAPENSVEFHPRVGGAPINKQVKMKGANRDTNRKGDVDKNEG